MLYRGDFVGYRIVYDQAGASKTTAHRKKNPKRLIAVIIIVAVLIAALSLSNKYKEPADPNVTERAFRAFSDNLKDGKGMKDSFAVFCKEIIAGAEIS